MKKLLNTSLQRIDVRKLRAMGILRKGSVVSTSLKWNEGSTVGLRCDEPGGVLTLDYKVTNHQSGTVTAVNYDVTIEKQPTNLPHGRGTIEYLLCPETGRRCEVLYRVPGRNRFVGRYALPRIYYGVQLLADIDALTDMRNTIDTQLQKSVPHKGHYRNRETSTQRRFNKLLKRLDKVEAKINDCIIERFGHIWT